MIGITAYHLREHDEHVWRLDQFYCKKFLECLFVLVFVLWVLYQIDYTIRLKQAYAYNHRIKDINFQNEQIEKLLGRKGGVVLYQTGLSRTAKQSINKENGNSEEDDVFLNDSESWIRYGGFSTRENGEQKLEVSKHESGPSRRSDIQVENILEVNESRSGIPSKEMVLGLEEIEDSRQAAMRDILQNDC